MSSLFEDVQEFHYEILDVQDSKPALPDINFMQERYRFMQEEMNEMLEACAEQNLVGIADALADLVYVALGTAHQIGLPFDRIWDEVHAANMRKVRGMTKRGNAIDAAKPAGWVGPEQRILEILTHASEQG